MVELGIIREDKSLALHVQVEPSKAVRQGSRHAHQRLEDNIRSLIRQFRIDGRLSRVAITAETAGGGKQADVIGIVETPRPSRDQPSSADDGWGKNHKFARTARQAITSTRLEM